MAQEDQAREQSKRSLESKAWLVIACWLALSLTIYSILGQFVLVIFTVSFGVAFPLAVYRVREKIRDFVNRHRLQRLVVYGLVAFLVSMIEESYVFALGGRIAFHSVLVDVIAVPVEWMPWYATWYLYLSRKYHYSDKEALLLAGTTGILFEYVGSGAILSSTPILVLSLPLYIVVYSALFILPMQFIRFSSGRDSSHWKYPLSIFLPYLATFPFIFLIYLLLNI